MSWVAVAGAAVGVVGSALTSKSGGAGSSTQSTQNTLDPRIANYLYGGSGGGGLLNNVNNLNAQQSASGGLNPMQNAGLELQRQTLMDPSYTAGYNQMKNLGSGLMNQGVAGNPFTGGQMASGTAPQTLAPTSPMTMQAGGSGGFQRATGPSAMASPMIGRNINANTVTGPMGSGQFTNAPASGSLGLAPVSSSTWGSPTGMNSTTAPAYQQIIPQTSGAPQAPQTINDILQQIQQNQQNQAPQMNPAQDPQYQAFQGGG